MPAIPSGIRHLTIEQVRVIRLVAEGRSYREIAELTDYAEGSVKTVVRRLADQLARATEDTPPRQAIRAWWKIHAPAVEEIIADALGRTGEELRAPEAALR